MLDKLRDVRLRYDEVNRRLQDPATVSDNKLFRDLMREYKNLTPLIEAMDEYEQGQEACREAKELLDELRPELNGRAVEDYLDKGISKREIRVAGRKVADLVVPLSAERYELDPEHKAEFREFADLHGLTIRKPKIKEGCEYEAMRFLQAERPDLVSESVEMAPGWQKILAPDGRGAKVGGTDYVVPGIIHIPPEP